MYFMIVSLNDFHVWHVYFYLSSSGVCPSCIERSYKNLCRQYPKESFVIMTSSCLDFNSGTWYNTYIDNKFH